ncbi:glycoside hydrolase family 15 [Macellibacteroides sp. HH-ZS]|nr:glycoside hydrolase family 15 [Macellibacteroides sp. HH-ZS]
MAAEKLFELWAKRNPNFEKRYEESIIKEYTDFGKGSSSFQESRGKIYGAGYEIYIIAFFIGLYHNRRKPLNEDTNKIKGFGQAIQYWGVRENRGLRKQYSEIQKYIFAALVARSDVDFIALDQDKINARKAVDILISTMEEYANFGFDYIEDKMLDNPVHFFKNSAFLDVFLSFTANENSIIEEDVESLD